MRTSHAHQTCYRLAEEADDPAPADSPEKPRLGSQLRVDFACPECGATGWVMWAKLARVMRCHSCRTRFWIDGTGHLVSERQSRSVKFTCPRCRHHDALPAQLLPTAIACPACEAHLELDANGSVEGGQSSTAASRGKHSRSALSGQPRRLWYYCAFLTAAILVLVMCAFGVRSMRPSGSMSSGSSQAALEKSAQQFTRLCLENRLDQAARFICADQHEHLRRWLACWRPVLETLDDGALARAEIAIQTVGQQADRTVLYVKIELDSRRSIGLTQQWLPGPDGWMFDAAAAFRAVAHGGD